MSACLNCYAPFEDGFCQNQNCLHPSFICPACLEVKGFINGSGDCQTCDTCCTCSENEEGEIIYCYPY